MCVRRSSSKMVEAVLLGLLAATVAAAAPGRTLQNLTLEERHCMTIQKVLYPANKNCYRLGEQGPCQEGQLLFMDDSNLLRDDAEVKVTPVCRPWRCFNQGTTAVYWPETGECLLKGRDGPKYCPAEGTELKTDVFGDGECACQKGHVRLADGAVSNRGGTPAAGHSRGGNRAVYVTDKVVEALFFRDRRQADGGWVLPDHITTKKPVEVATRGSPSWEWGQPAAAPDSQARCWPLFERGPCATSEVLFPGGGCQPDPCFRHNRERSRGREAFVMVDGRCAQLGSNCSSENKVKATVQLQELSGEPACVSSTSLLHLVDPLPNCAVGASGDCEKEVSVPKDGEEDYYKMLLQSIDKKRRKRRTRNPVGRGANSAL